jgi:7-cyano-7-deazaguanine synthase
MKPKSIILLSGGLDSTVSAAVARRRTQPLFALTFDYRQRAAKREIEAARRICGALRIKHRIVQLPFFREYKKLAMLGGTRRASLKHFSKLEDVWVPNRNGLFVNVAACYGEYYNAALIITGFNREEAQEFPDNSARFVQAINKSLSYSTLGKIKVKSYVADLSKKEIYCLGLKYKAPLKYVYSCYLGGAQMCGKCASCKRFIEASRE